MSTSNEFETIDVIELGRNLVTEEPASTARRNSPGLNIFRITPNQVAERTLMGDFLGSRNDTNLVNCTNLRAQTAVNAEDFTIHNGSENKEVKDLAAGLPNRCVAVLLLALFVEAIDLGDLA
jgi:hypothetical protein